MTALTPGWGMRPASRSVATAWIKPNDRLTSFDRLEVYNRQYWYRLIDSFYDDYPGLRVVLGEHKFNKLCRAYLEEHGSTSFTLRDLGQHLERFLRNHRLGSLALDMARLEWARIVAFDGAAQPVVTGDDLLGRKPSRIRLALQPYLTLLKLRYPLDDFLIAVKQLNTEALRGEASNAVISVRHKRVKGLRRPRPATVYIAVHRVNNAVYYKRLTRQQFTLLSALQTGQSLQPACAAVSATADLQSWFAQWAEFGWFWRPT